MTTKDIIKGVLEKWKFPVIRETETSLGFRYQLCYVHANVCEDEDNTAITLTLSGLFSSSNDKEMAIALRACNTLNRNLLQVKLYIDADSDLIIASEFFFKTPDDMEYLISMGLRYMIVAKKQFTQKYGELEAEADLMSELEEE